MSKFTRSQFLFFGAVLTTILVLAIILTVQRSSTSETPSTESQNAAPPPSKLTSPTTNAPNDDAKRNASCVEEAAKAKTDDFKVLVAFPFGETSDFGYSNSPPADGKYGLTAFARKTNKGWERATGIEFGKVSAMYSFPEKQKFTVGFDARYSEFDSGCVYSASPEVALPLRKFVASTSDFFRAPSEGEKSSFAKARAACKPKKAVHADNLSAEEVLCSNEVVEVTAVSNDAEDGAVVSLWISWGNRMVHASLDVKKASFSQVLAWAPTYD